MSQDTPMRNAVIFHFRFYVILKMYHVSFAALSFDTCKTTRMIIYILNYFRLLKHKLHALKVH